jgi:thiamine biosynthesis lipoprotein
VNLALMDGEPVVARDDLPVATRSMRAIGTSATIAVTLPGRVDEAMALLSDDLGAIDAACSRFRPDSEIRRVEERSDGRPVAVSPLLFESLEVAGAVAMQTAGIVDPTVGSALIELGYDRDFEQIPADDLPSAFRPRPAPGWWQVELDPDARTASVPTGVHLDLGATAKAFVADRSARRIAVALRCGVLVNLGGDVAVSGPSPSGGWAIGIAPECTTPLEAVDQVVSVSAGGLATSGTTARSWVRDGRTVHHIVDPWTGEPAPAVWSMVSTMAPSCVEANAWSTAAVVWGHDAIGNLASVGIPARLVSAGGDIVLLGGWPLDADGHGDDGRSAPGGSREAR